MAEKERQDKIEEQVQQKPGNGNDHDKLKMENSSSEYIIQIDADLVRASDSTVLTSSSDGSLTIHLGMLTGGLHASEERDPLAGKAKKVVLKLHLKKP